MKKIPPQPHPLERRNELAEGGGRRFDPGLFQRSGRPECDARRIRFEGFSHPANTFCHSEHAFVGYNDVKGGFEQPYSIAARGREKMEDPSAMSQ